MLVTGGTVHHHGGGLQLMASPDGGRFSPPELREHGETTSPSSGASSSDSCHLSDTPIKAIMKIQLEESKARGMELSPLERLQFAMGAQDASSSTFEEDDKEHEDEDDQMVEEDDKTGMAGQVMLENGMSAATNIFQCILCSVTCNNRHQFNEHMVSHAQQKACPKCDFLTNDQEAFMEHLEQVHEIKGDEVLPDDEVRVPKVNSQGKLKTFKCKQCDYRAVTKLDFWNHTKTHIRKEKMITCPKCPFVTEYKHHFEYHLRNHQGSKPFQCTKCPYSCVNKSMLNSHLKSHSSVYQYRCADCAYATKYCHSLKLHLRKYKHNPSMVLNLDGTPNPLPIIDVYGTRRGPKVKRQQQGQQEPAEFMDHNGNSSTSTNSNLAILGGGGGGGDRRKKSNASSLGSCGTGGGRRGSKKSAASSLSMSSSSDEGHHTDDSSNHDMYNGYFDSRSPPTMVAPQRSPTSRSSNNNGGANKSPMELYAAMAMASNPWLQLTSQLTPDLAVFAQEQQRLLSQLMTSNAMAQNQLLAELQRVSPPNNVQAASGTGAPTKMMDSTAAASTPLDLRRSSPTAPVEKRRSRKPKEVVRHSATPYYETEEADEALDFSKKSAPNTVSGGLDKETKCRHCDISFPDHVLYSIHASYHSPIGSPFDCRACGKRTGDKTSFFLHLTTDPH